MDPIDWALKTPDERAAFDQQQRALGFSAGLVDFNSNTAPTYARFVAPAPAGGNYELGNAIAAPYPNSLGDIPGPSALLNLQALNVPTGGVAPGALNQLKASLGLGGASGGGGLSLTTVIIIVLAAVLLARR